MLTPRLVRACALGSITGLIPLDIEAQGTIADYRRAAAVNQRLTGLTVDVAQQPTWTGSTRFWYRKSVKGGNQFVLVDAATAEKRPPFDHARLATALTSVARPDSAYTAVRLPFTSFTLVNDDAAVEVDANRCSLALHARGVRMYTDRRGRGPGLPGGRRSRWWRIAGRWRWTGAYAFHGVRVA